MDVPPSATDAAAKKAALEDMSKEELIKKCKSLLLIAQKAKQSKDVLSDENNDLKARIAAVDKSLEASNEIVENVTKQKLDLVNTIQDLQVQNDVCEEKMRNVHGRMTDLDTENISFRRQVSRLTDENEQLLVHLENLEKKIQQLTDEGLQQQEQLLFLEHKNAELTNAGSSGEGNIAELQGMLARSLEEVKNLQADLQDKTVHLEELCGKEERLLLLNAEKDAAVQHLNSEIEHLKSEIENLKADNSNSSKLEMDQLRLELESLLVENENLCRDVSTLKEQLSSKKEALQKYVEEMDELKTSMHKSVALNERLQQDLKNANERLSDNQIFTSGVTSDLENANEKLREKLRNYHAKIVKLASDIKALKQNRHDLLDNFKLYTGQVKTWKDELNRFADIFNNLLATSNQEKKKLTEEVDRLKTTITDLQTERANLQELHENDLELSQKSGQEILSLVEENKQLLKTNESLKDELDAIRLQKLKSKDACHQTVEEFPVSDTDLNEQFSTLKREHHEVLNEMNQMNQALKERGETISKQQAYCDELMKKIQIFEAQLNKKCETLVEKEELISRLQEQLDETASSDVTNANSNTKNEETVTKLQKEIELLKERLEKSNENANENANENSNANESLYAESENMSTSTMSKAEDSSRMKDLEGSWEERYGKLRQLAVKLKAKVRALAADLSKEQTDKAELQQKLVANLKALQSLQNENDHLQDELESSRKDAKSYLKKLDNIAVDISKDKQLLAANDEQLTALKAELDAHQKEKIAVDTWKKQVGLKVQSLRKELEANALLRKDSEAKTAKLQADLEQAEKLLKQERDKHHATRTTLQESNNECKKQSVLNLEMQDYERSIKDLSQKLDMRQELVAKLKAQLETQKTTLNTLKEQNKVLEDRCSADSADLEANKRELQAYKAKINELEALLTEKDSKALELTRQQETTRIENEDLASQLSSIVADNQKLVGAIKAEKEGLRISNIGLEQKVRELKAEMALKADELEKLREEHQAYKVRAQSVLRQNQSRDVGLEENLKQEIATLQAQIGILSSDIEEQKKALENASRASADVISEKEALIAENAEIKQELTQWSEKFAQLSNKHQQVVAENAETIRGLKVHADTLSQCYRQQLSDQETRHNREVIELQSKLEKGGSPPDIPPLLLPSMQREECEGSESVDSTYNAPGSQPVPLEKLLGADSDQEMAIVRKQLLENESKVAHLTALLADTEQDLVKHVQMNKLLKEEIRRQQRSVEREQHAENLEYLKNIVFKFVTLNSGDERVRLVPVLNTILKLSPEETGKLNMVAKGDKAWADYLPTWASKPQ